MLPEFPQLAGDVLITTSGRSLEVGSHGLRTVRRLFDEQGSSPTRRPGEALHRELRLDDRLTYRQMAARQHLRRRSATVPRYR